MLGGNAIHPATGESFSELRTVLMLSHHFKAHYVGSVASRNLYEERHELTAQQAPQMLQIARRWNVMWFVAVDFATTNWWVERSSQEEILASTDALLIIVNLTSIVSWLDTFTQSRQPRGITPSSRLLQTSLTLASSSRPIASRRQETVHGFRDRAKQ